METEHEASHNERLTRLLECFPSTPPYGQNRIIHRGNYTIRLVRNHNNIHIELYSGTGSFFECLEKEPLLNTPLGGDMVERVLRFKTNWDARHTGLQHDHLLLSMELARIFSILIPEHMPK